MISKKLYSLQFKTTENFNNNLLHLLSLIQKCSNDSIILAPEVCLSGFCYDRMDEACEVSKKAKDRLKNESIGKSIGLTMIEKEEDGYYNNFYMFSGGEIIHKQAKAKLFKLGQEHQYFKEGRVEDIKPFIVDGLKIGVLICFELRFINLWQRLNGCDVILVPAMWGRPRKHNYETLTNALAITLQSFVIASDSTNDDMASSSGIITPFGKDLRHDTKEIISHFADFSEVDKVRKYIDISEHE
ncbi:MAG: carbon-nitrogen hydrolase family protein [Campylobacterales bacterium]|nr:carbon-nitrogen hydrolase family protein [Campylobacterales bacterium]